MHVPRALNENSCRKIVTPVYIFIDCPVSKEYCENYFFQVIPSLYLWLTMIKAKQQSEKKHFNVITVMFFLDIKANLTSILNDVPGVPVLFIVFRTIAWKLMRNTYNKKKIFSLQL